MSHKVVECDWFVRTKILEQLDNGVLPNYDIYLDDLTLILLHSLMMICYRTS